MEVEVGVVLVLEVLLVVGVTFCVAVMGLLELEVCEELAGFRWESSEPSNDWEARQDAEET